MPRLPLAPVRPPVRSLLVGLGVALSLVLASCTDGGDGGDQVVGEPGSSTSTSTTVAANTTTTADEETTSTTAAPPATTTTVPFDGGTDPVSIPRPATTEDVVAHTDLGITSAPGGERVTFGFDGALPGVEARYVERPVRQAGSGDEVEVAGEAVLAISFSPASSARFDGEDIVRTYDGPDRLEGGGTVREVVRTGDFEALYEWVLGITSRSPFRVDFDEAASTITIVFPPS